MTQVIKKTVIRSTDVLPSASTSTTSHTPTSAQQLLRSIQGSSIFKPNNVNQFSSLSTSPAASSSSQIQSLHVANVNKPLGLGGSGAGDFQKLTARKIAPGADGSTNSEQQQQQSLHISSTGNTPRTGRRRRRRALTICMAHCRYDIVRKTSEKFGLVEVSEDQPWNIYWTDYSVSLERAVEMRRYQVSSKKENGKRRLMNKKDDFSSDRQRQQSTYIEYK